MHSMKIILHNCFVIKKAYDSLWDQIMEKFNLTRAEIDVLAFISANPELNTAHEVVEYRMIAKSHVSKAVDHLIEIGYLIREQDRNDRRCIHLNITERAKEAISAIHDKQIEFSQRLVEGFSERELEMIREATTKVAKNAEERT